jgi:hypothetical protein
LKRRMVIRAEILQGDFVVNRPIASQHETSSYRLPGLNVYCVVPNWKSNKRGRKLL